MDDSVILAQTNSSNGHSNHYIWLVIFGVLILLATMFIAMTMGSAGVSFEEVVRSVFVCPTQTEGCAVNPIAHQIIWEIRLPRILMALLTGAGLSITGAILQSVTRNPLADPYLFGISSGASLGAVIAMTILSSGMLSVTAGALIGGVFSVGLMLTLAGRSAVNVERLLLSGVAVSFMLSAFTSLILYYSSPETAATLLFWMMGSFSNSHWGELWLPLIVIVAGVSLFFCVPALAGSDSSGR